MGKFSSRKGAAFERRIAKMFEDAYGYAISRTPQSGGWGKHFTSGDLVAPEHPEFPWFCECKNDQSWNLWSSIFENKGMVDKWWIKACRQAKNEGKEPLLVIGQDVQKPLVLFENCSAFIHMRPIIFISLGKNNEMTVCVMRLDQFLKTIT